MSDTILLDKVNTTRSINLDKSESVEIAVNLNWNQGEPKGFFGRIFGGAKEPVDLDLGCLYELKNGDKSAVQALGNAFGSKDQAPYIALDGDDRTGESKDGEWLRINGLKWSEIKRVLIYTFIYEGAANWSETDGSITIHVKGQPSITTKLEGTDNSKTFCVAALLENDNGQVKVTRVDRYFAGHEEADRAFHWGLHWRAGHK
jgi:tellurite resistance protein TerA